MAHPNHRVRSNSMASPVIANPDAVQGLINEFFMYNGTSKEVEETLWRMFDGSISNPEYPTDPAENGNQAHVYRILSELVRQLEKYKGDTYIEFPEN